MNKFIKLSFCTIQIKDNIIIATINEGVHLNKELSQKIVMIGHKYIGDQPAIYITNRINSYSVDPTIYSYISKITTIVGFCVVSQKPITIDNLSVENLFYKNKFNHFLKLEDAIIWSKNKLKSLKLD